MTLKQKVLNSIDELPSNASLDDIMLKVYQLHKTELTLLHNSRDIGVDVNLLTDKLINN